MTKQSLSKFTKDPLMLSIFPKAIYSVTHVVKSFQPSISLHLLGSSFRKFCDACLGRMTATSTETKSLINLRSCYPTYGSRLSLKAPPSFHSTNNLFRKITGHSLVMQKNASTSTQSTMNYFISVSRRNIRKIAVAFSGHSSQN